MNRKIAIALASASLTAFSAHADVQTAFPDGYVILEADARPAGNLPRADVQTAFPDGYVIVEAGEEVRTAGFSHAELVGSFPQPSFVDYIARTSGEATDWKALVALEKRGD